jgi:hypothetical protein
MSHNEAGAICLDTGVGEGRRVGSLWEMIYHAGVFSQMLIHLDVLRISFSEKNPLERISPLDTGSLITIFVGFQMTAHPFGLSHTLAATEPVIGPHQLKHPRELLTHIVKTNGDALARIRQLNEAFRKDTGERCFYFLREGNQKIYEQTFASDLDTAFPSAMKEIREANTCFALDRYTACVFHLMRASEHAYRALAVALRVKKPITALEYDTWGQLLKQIEGRRDLILNVLQGPKKPLIAAREFFNPAISDMRYYMDAVRNIVMHTRTGGTYDINQATSIRNRVRDSLQHMAKYVSEDGPKITAATFKRMK